MEDSSQIANQPDTYEPVIDESGNYVDQIPIFNESRRTNGLRCPCANNSHVFKSRTSMNTHIKAKCHQKWIEKLNNEKVNYLTEATNLRVIVNQQKLIIAQMEKELAQNRYVIGILTDKLTEGMPMPPHSTLPIHETVNLLD